MVIENVKHKLILELLIYVMGVAFVAFFYRNNAFVTTMLTLAWFIAMGVWHKKEDVLVFVVAAVIGPLGEIVAVYFGAWTYANPTFWGIPIWLPLLWGLAGVFIKRVGLHLSKLK